MKKQRLFLLVVLLMTLTFPCMSQNYDFSAVAPSGQTLYYKYVYGSSRDVSVSRPSSSVSYPWSGYTEPTGDLIIPDSVIYNDTTYAVTRIGQKAFYNCSGLTSVTIPSSVTNISYYSFNGCTGLTTVNFNADSCTFMGNNSHFPFENCSSLTTLNIGYNVKNIPSYAFFGCSGVKYVYVPSTVQHIGVQAFGGVRVVDYCGDSLNNYPWGATFARCSEGDFVYLDSAKTTILLYVGDSSSVVIPSTVTHIQSEAFSGSSSLVTLTISKSVCAIGNAAFSNCPLLDTVNFFADSCYSMGGRGSSNVFYGCSNIRMLNIGDNVKCIPNFAFADCGFQGVLTIPDSVTRVGRCSFRNNRFSKVTIGRAVNVIEDSVFSGCTLLDTINFMADSCVIMGREWQQRYQSGRTYTLTASSFSGCSSISTINISNNVRRIPRMAFQNIQDVTTITIPGSVTYIGDEAFAGCSGLSSLTIPVSVDSIGKKSFAYCYNLSAITIPRNVVKIGTSAFLNCIRLARVNFSADSCVSMGSYDAPVFENCTSLVTLNIADNVQRVPANAFLGCTNVTAVIIPSSVNAIGSRAFYGCSRLVAIGMFGEEPPIAGYSAFGDIHSSASFVVPCGSYSAYLNAGYSAWGSIVEPPSPSFTLSLRSSNNFMGMVRVYEQNGRRIQCDSTAVIEAIGKRDDNGVWGSTFVQWSDGNTDNPRTVHLWGDTVFTAIFAPATDYWIGAVSDDTTMGIVEGGGNYNFGDTVTLTAIPVMHYHFTRWSDGSTTNPRRFQASGQRTLTAYFAPDQYTITVTSSDPLRGSVEGGGTFTYPEATTVSATAYSGYQFVRWSNGVGHNPYTFAVTADMDLVAVFIPEGTIYNITAVSENPSMGTVTGGGPYGVGERAVLTAIPEPGYQFDRWSDGSRQNPRTVTVSADATYTAYFSETVGIEEVEGYDQSGLRLYPNPAHSSVTVTGLEPGRRIALVDLYGRTLADLRASSTELTIDVSALSPGTYFVRVEGLPAQKVVVIN